MGEGSDIRMLRAEQARFSAAGELRAVIPEFRELFSFGSPTRVRVSVTFCGLCAIDTSATERSDFSDLAKSLTRHELPSARRSARELETNYKAKRKNISCREKNGEALL